VIGNLVVLLVLAALAGAFALVLFSVLGRVESRAHLKREAGLARSRRLDRRAFVIGVIVVAAMVAGGATLYLNRGRERRGVSARPGQASPKPWRRMNGPKLWRSGTEYWRALSSDQP